MRRGDTSATLAPDFKCNGGLWWDRPIWCPVCEQVAAGFAFVSRGPDDQRLQYYHASEFGYCWETCDCVFWYARVQGCLVPTVRKKQNPGMSGHDDGDRDRTGNGDLVNRTEDGMVCRETGIFWREPTSDGYDNMRPKIDAELAAAPE